MLRTSLYRQVLERGGDVYVEMHEPDDMPLETVSTEGTAPIMTDMTATVPIVPIGVDDEPQRAPIASTCRSPSSRSGRG